MTSSKNTKTRKPTRIAPGMATLTAILTISAACNSIGSDEDTTASGASPGPDPGSTSECQIGTGDDLAATAWTTAETNGGTEQPAAVVVLEQAYDLPGTHASLADEEGFAGGSSVLFPGQPHQGLTQYEDNSIGVIAQFELDNDSAVLAVLDPATGQITGQYDAITATAAPRLSSTAPGQTVSGYHRVEADGIEIPAAAAGDEVNQTYVLAAMADSSDDGTVWVLLGGSDRLYSGTIYAGDPDAEHALGQGFDTSGC